MAGETLRNNYLHKIPSPLSEPRQNGEATQGCKKALYASTSPSGILQAKLQAREMGPTPHAHNYSAFFFCLLLRRTKIQANAYKCVVAVI